MSDWDEERAHRNRRPDKTYASPRLTTFGEAPVRIAHKVVDHDGGYAFAKQLDEIESAPRASKAGAFGCLLL